jgi:hypothetical protein
MAVYELPGVWTTLSENPHGRGDEPLHEITFRRSHIGLVDIDTMLAQSPCEL